MFRFILVSRSALARLIFSATFLVALVFSQYAISQDVSSVAGLYKVIFQHEGTNYYQFGLITLKTTNPSGEFKISANMRIIFGAADSNEFLTYEFANVPLNPITGQLVFTNDGSDVSAVAILKGGQIEGDWYSSIVGRVGKFIATKDNFPVPPLASTNVKELSGYYRGILANTNPQSSLPERLTMSFVATQDLSGPTPKLAINGNLRLYLGSFNSLEYIEIKFTDVQFNSYSRFLTAKTENYGLTFKGYMSYDATAEGDLYTDGLGKVGRVTMQKWP